MIQSFCLRSLRVAIGNCLTGICHRKEDAEDLVEGCVTALNKNAENKTYQSIELAELIRSGINPKMKIEIKGEREKDYMGELNLDNKHMALKDINWRPRISLAEGVTKYTEWITKNENMQHGI